MWLCAAIVLAAYVLIVMDRVDRAIPALTGAAIIVVLGLVPYEDALDYVELDVLLLLIGMMIVVQILAETGLFEWVAIYIAQKARGDGWKILTGLLAATALLSSLLDNVTTIILIMPITLLICEILAFPVVPFIILEVMFANIGGAATLIGDPPNILIGHAGHLSFMEFIWHLAPIAAVVGAVAAALTHLRYRSVFVATEAARQQIMQAEPNLAIVDPAGLRRAAPVFLLILAGFVLSHPLGVGPGVMAMTGAGIMTIVARRNFEHVLRAVEWNTILFLGALFVLVGALNHYGVFGRLEQLVFGGLTGRPWLVALALLWLSGIASALLGSVPITMAFIPVVQSLISALCAEHGLDERTAGEPLWWALALGACLGANGTMLGAPVNVVAAQNARQNHAEISFLHFLAFGVPFALLGLALSSVYLYLRYYYLAIP